MFNRIFSNFKTTLGGLAVGILQYTTSSPSGFTWKGALTALPSLLLGMFSKD